MLAGLADEGMCRISVLYKQLTALVRSHMSRGEPYQLRMNLLLAWISHIMH